MRACYTFTHRLHLLLSWALGMLLCGFSASAFAAIAVSDNNTHVDRGVLYSNLSFLTASGGTAPYTFSATGMPIGFTLNSDGTASGVTCGANGNFPLDLTVTDNLGATATFSNKTMIVNAAPAGGCSLSFTSSTVPAGTVGTPYSTNLSVTGGSSPYTYSVSNGSLPTGLSLSSGGTISGTPSSAGTYTFSVLAVDGSSDTGVQTYSMTINAAATPPITGSVSQTIAYNSGSASATTVTLNLSGGAATSVAVATPASHGTATAGGTSITYLPTANYIGTDSFTYTATNGSGTSSPSTVTITVSAPTIVVAPTTLPNATVSSAYSQNITASGGLASYSYAITSGSLPAGLTLSSGGVLSGTPTTNGVSNFTVTATDSSTGTAATGSRAYSLTTNVAAPVAGAVNQTVTYNAGAASATTITLNLSGGAATSVAVATPASHGTATASGTSITYLPTANYIGTDSFTYTATNGSGTSSPATATITVSAPTIVIAPTTLPNATVGSAYSQNITASGGLASYSYAITSGTLPTGLTLSTGGVLSGTPTTNGASNFTITATDSSTGTAASGARAYSLTTNIGNPIAGAVSQTVTYNAGSASATTITLNLSGGAATSVAVATPASHGTATAGGTSITYLPTANYIGTDSFTYTATNGSGTSSPATVTVTVSAPTVLISPSTLPAATEGTAYSQNVSASGGLASYSYTVTSGSLPTGLSLASNGTLSGTPTAPGTGNFTITATDSSSGTAATGSQAYTFTVNAPGVVAPVANSGSQTIAYNSGSAAATTINLSTSGTVVSVAVASAATHGTAIASGTGITYTPNANYIGPDSFTYTATNSGGTSAPATISITVSSTTIVISPSTLPAATVGVVYAQSLSANGGLASYSYAVTAGSLPAGLTLSSSGVLSGTPTTAASSNFTITTTDSSSGTPATASQAYTFVVNAGIAAPTASTVTQSVNYNAGANAGAAIALNLSGGAATSIAIATAPTHGTATVSGLSVTYTPVAQYFGQDSFTYTATNASGTSAPAMVTLTISAPTLAITVTVASVTFTENTPITAYVPVTLTGGAGNLVYSISPALPAGLTLNTSTGAISGTPTAVTATTNFTVTVTDAAHQTSSGIFSIKVAAQQGTLTITPAALPSARYKSSYQQALSVSGGVAPYTWSVSAGALPAGLSLSSTGVLSGKPTASGTFTITVTDANGHTGTRAYTFTVQTRPDPAQDAAVRAQIAAQMQAAQRFSQTQINTVSEHLEQLHGGFDPCADNADVQLNHSTANNPNVNLKREIAAATEVAPPASKPSNDAATNSSAHECLNEKLFGAAAIGVWSGGAINFGSTGIGAATNKFNSSGISVGIDRRMSKNMVAGLALGYGWDSGKSDSHGTQTDADAKSATLYATYRFDHWSVDALLGKQTLSSDNRRWVKDDGVLVNGKRNGSSWLASVGVSTRIKYSKFTLEPGLRGDYIASRLKGYSETGATDLALTYNDTDVRSNTLVGSMIAMYDIELAASRLTPSIKLEYSRSSDSNQVQTMYYTDLGADTPYTMTLNSLPRSVLNGQLGLRFSTNGLQSEISYGYATGNNAWISRSVNANVRLGF